MRAVQSCLLLGAGVVLILACGGRKDAPAKPTADESPEAASGEPIPGEPKSAASSAGACDPLPPPPLPGPGCLAGVLACGGTLRSTTAGGSAVFDGERYVDSYCFPTAREGHRGPERAFRFELPAGQRATVRLESPCGELALAALRWEPSDRCPEPGDRVAECEGRTGYGTQEVELVSAQAAHYLVIVDQSETEALPFTLSVTCAAAG